MGRTLTLIVLCWYGTWCQANPWTLPTQSFPIITSAMSPMIVTINRTLSYPLAASVAIVGVDALSASWLKLNNAYLLKVNAIGLVVNVPSIAQLQVLGTYTDIPLIPMQGNALRDQFGQYYPLLVDQLTQRVRQ